MFTRSAKVKVLAVGELAPSDGGPYLSFAKSGSLAKTGSYYEINAGPLDVAAMLSKVAGEYEISADPKDYLFEAIRAVTSSIANENGDGFAKQELLRYDHRLGRAVYQTFILKPHHINHRAENPKTARGVILDAHYNDLSEALPTCPKCSARTANVEDRDDGTGLECRKCGTVVKDEFIELLVAVDRSKDPSFARGVEAGVLNAGSMGCTCERTRCSICNHIAHTKSEFCEHIRAGNKKKLFKTAQGNKTAFEWCEGVVFSEYSRVDQPADPTALQREVFASAEIPKVSATAMAAESEALITSTRLNHLEQRVAGITASPQIPIKDYIEQSDNTKEHPDKLSAEEIGMIPRDEGPLPSEHKVSKAEEPHMAQNPSRLKFAQAYDHVSVQITTAGNARVFTPKGTICVIKPEKKLASSEESLAFANAVLASIAEHGMVKMMIDHKAIVSAKTAQVLEFHIEDFDGGREEGDKSPITEGDSEVGAEKVRLTVEKTVLSPEESDRKDEPHEQKDLNDSILTSRTPDFEDEVHTAPDTVLTEEMTDAKERHKPKNVKERWTDGPIVDHKGAAKTAEKSSVEVKSRDVETKKVEGQMAPMPPATPGAAPGAPAPAPMQPMADTKCEACGGVGCAACKMADMPMKPMDGMKCEACGGVGCVACMSKTGEKLSKEAALEQRLKKLYQTRFAALQTDSETKIAAAHAEVFEHLSRCFKIASKRQALNLEISPLKVAFGDVLIQPMDLDASSYYPGMDQQTAVAIIERAAAVGFDSFIDSLLVRAADLMTKGEDFLKSAEEDLKHLATVSPPVSETASFDMEAAVEEEPELVREANKGNLMLAPTATERYATFQDSENPRRTALRAALGKTAVRNLTARLGQ